METISTPIIVLENIDLENVGFKSDLTIDQWHQVVRYMTKAYENDMDIFWENLRYACEMAKVEKL